MNFPSRVILKEVGPRDGLQHESRNVSTANKVMWINMLSDSGLRYIECSSFVSSSWIPALSDAEEVFKQIKRHPDAIYCALVPNVKGMERALASNVDELSVFISASATHNRKNINKSKQETYPVLDEVIKGSLAEKKRVRGYISMVFGCPYEGEIAIEEVKKVCEKLFHMGVYEISLGDTIGIAHPKQVERLLTELKNYFGNLDNFALHFHDTRGLGIANSLVGLQAGIQTFDGSLGGLGGCPYAKGASGNIATEDLAFMLEQMGIATFIQQEALMNAAMFIEKVLNHNLPSHQLNLYKKGVDSWNLFAQK
ncbi:hydroxymethylglutaryl-CoA lyase [Salipaludibacillus sp. CF4.18]|uniref:hydroxymethylglutaryl-CoA lyase n=1 Tax=Salipaludibacillus sp. CF4.18 TaxID=3373081 RepID=UPI003EE7B3A6